MPQNLDIKKKSDWIEGKRPHFFFGPCSAESPEQLRSTAAGIAKNYGKIIFRAGVWKPRTRPNTFEGVGSEALEWMREIREEFGFQLTTEVANPEHVEDCLKAGIDILWVGARTTVNPFSVQAIADALQGVDLPVFVKNPINPDLSLWMGALERINKAGIDKLGAIHRGFHLADNGPYRNAPNWNLAIELKSAYPELPLICDVSHIAGKRNLIGHVAQKGIDLDMDGLMVETHIDAEKALSDPQQQLTPEQLHELIKNLTPKKKSSDDQEFRSQLEVLRDEIDKIDEELLERIAVRMNLAKQIGEYKKNNKVTVLQVNRWQEILQNSLKQGEALGLSKKFVRALLNAIHDESISQQTLIQEE